jgi:hypothetical protein
MRKIVTGEQIAQLTNPDPFAVPTWRAPVYRTPGWIITLVQLARFLWWLARLIIRHPVIDAVLAVLVLVWLNAGWPGLVVLAAVVMTVLGVWRWARPVSFSQWIATPARGKWRAWWCYRRRWDAVMTVAGLAPFYQGRLLLPVLGKVSSTRYTDRVAVRLVSGQSAADFRTARTIWRTGWARCCAGSAPHALGRCFWSSSAATPWLRSSPPCPSPCTRTCGRCRSAAVRMGCRGWFACMARIC